MLILSIYVVLQLSFEVILDLSERTQLILTWIDFTICIVFLLDWFFFFLRSTEKKQYLKTRFIDLVASIPFTQILRPLRILRIVRIVRTLRIVRSLKGAFPLLRVLLKNPARSALSVYLTITLVIYFYCSVGLYNVEREVNSSISNFGDVLWMSFTTLTSVGYGDIYPVTGGGRILAAVLVITGMGLFSLLTAEIATLIMKIVKPKNSKE